MKSENTMSNTMMTRRNEDPEETEVIIFLDEETLTDEERTGLLP